MATPIAGPSQSPMQHSSHPTSGSMPPNDAKRRTESDQNERRAKYARPPLPPPHVLSTLVPDSPAFVDLTKVEQKLDWTLLRKKAEINDTLGRPVRVKRTLRVFLSNTAHDQDWQKEHDQKQAGEDGQPSSSIAAQGEVKPDPSATKADVENGKGIPGWVLRVEGRLVDSGNARLDKIKRKFTSFIKSAVVEFDQREAPTYPEGNIVEWHPQSLTNHMDGFEILRRGDKNVDCRLVLHINHFPERFRVMEPLAGLVGMKEGTRSEVMAGIWKLVKFSGAQDKEDGSIIRPTGGLEKLTPAGSEVIAFHQLPEIVTRFLAQPEPIVIPYTIRIDQDYNFHSKCFDIPIEIEDPQKSKMAQIVQSFEGEEGREIVKLEDKVAELAYFARDLKQKKDFLESFASNPQAFIQNWLAAQARDLDQMLGYQVGTIGTNGGSVREEDLRRSDLFNLPWVDEAVMIHETARMEAERKGVQQR